jgi:hypothetical protein
VALIAIPVPGKAKSKMLCEAFIAGAPREAKGFVLYGVKASNAEAYRAMRRSGADFYAIDNSYYDQTRGTMFRVTKNAFQCTARLDDETDLQRLWGLVGAEVEPLVDRPKGYTLIVEQSPDHMDYVAEDASQFYALCKYLRAKHKTRTREWHANKPTLMATLAADLAGANHVVTHSSAAGVMAVMAGIPVSCSPFCVAYGDRLWDDRLHWAGVLADNQFSLNEMKDGTAWQQVNR